MPNARAQELSDPGLSGFLIPSRERGNLAEIRGSQRRSFETYVPIQAALRPIRILLWLYIGLLLGEGALRIFQESAGHWKELGLGESL